MPRRPRIESIGYHHIINRGVARQNIFLKDDDYRTFLDLLHVSKLRYNFTVHSLCLMPNHYHLLIKTSYENLSMLARQINSKYAQYFNREYERVGPLWQGRFKNWYVYDEKYLYNLFKYIEQNPIKTKISKKIGEYSWSASTFLIRNEYVELLEDSELPNILKSGFLDETLVLADLDELNIFHKTVYKDIDTVTIRQKQKGLGEHFKSFKNISERNAKILDATHDGYMQTEIAKYLNMTNANVSRILSQMKI
jgi:REP element-mobilizing transposase RayT